MPVDIFDTVINHRWFGICDNPPPPATPAFIDIHDRKTWIAEVDNFIKADITFVPIDNRLVLKHKRCDVALAYNSTVIFIELKLRTSYGWKNDAEIQLRDTIRYFEKNAEAKKFLTKKAYNANGRRPKFNENNMPREKKFLKDTGYSLAITNRIRIE